MWIILGIFFSFTAWALHPAEQLPNVKILKVLPDNVVLLNKGLEDGLLRNDHIMLKNQLVGYATRGLCLQARPTTSYWKLYRIPDAKAISQDYTYTLVGLADREIPLPQALLRDKSITIEEEKKNEDSISPDPFEVQGDLPNQLTERDLIDAVGPEQRKLFVEKAISLDQLKRDLKDYRLSFYASPFTRQSIINGESYRYGVRGGNIASKYRLLTQFEQQRTHLKDPLTQESVSTSSTTGKAQFVVRELRPWVSTLSLIHFNSTKFSSLGTPRSHWQIGPIGLTWHLFESKNWEYLDLSYVPLYDIRRTDTLDADQKSGIDQTYGLRHGLRLALKVKINERVALENLLWVRPFQDLSTWKVESNNLNLENDLKLVFNLVEDLYFDYNFIYQKDKLWSSLSGLTDTNTINSLNLRYDWDI